MKSIYKTASIVGILKISTLDEVRVWTAAILLSCLAMMAKPQIAIVGPGNLGSALGVALHNAGYAISEIVCRERESTRQRGRRLARAVGARARTTKSAKWTADLVWLCVPDREIATCAFSLVSSTEWKDKVVFHSSGALTSDQLRLLRRQGAAVASVHPMMTFVKGVTPSLQGVPFAIEGDPSATGVASRIARQLGGTPFFIDKRQKVAYHAWGAFTSPLLISLLVVAEKVAALAGLTAHRARQMVLPMLRQTIENYGERGPDNAFSGPIVRGDVATVSRHLDFLSQIAEAKQVYLALARFALGSLPSKHRGQLAQLLRK